jgi:Fur family ferric uptake transcriptional regulator
LVRKAQYQTKQMAELLNYLCSVQGQHVTVQDVCNYFKSKGITMGTTTVYRHLERMVEEGSVAKYIVDGTSSACFEYLGTQAKCSKPICFHCKCEKCGRLIHLKCDELANIRQHVLEHHGFQVDSMRTVFYGICEECRSDSADKGE